jgi:sulfur relay (sulfurtransferase) DsrC/TusE family protein
VAGCSEMKWNLSRSHLEIMKWLRGFLISYHFIPLLSNYMPLCPTTLTLSPRDVLRLFPT